MSIMSESCDRCESARMCECRILRRCRWQGDLSLSFRGMPYSHGCSEWSGFAQVRVKPR